MFVHENNLYYQAGVDDAPFALTADGAEFKYNGVSDWLYEGECERLYGACHKTPQNFMAIIDVRRILHGEEKSVKENFDS